MRSQPTVLPWHKQAASDIFGPEETVKWVTEDECAAIIARHDPATPPTHPPQPNPHMKTDKMARK